MARRRYVSTEISIDKQVNKLAMQYGDFAALLYTWMIPHAEDNCLIIADPYELLNKVVPGRRDKTEDDVQAAIEGMLKLKLITMTEDGKMLRFKAKTFYKYQSYIPVNKRYEDEPKPPAENPIAENEEQKSSTGEIFQFYQSNLGMITPYQAQEITNYLDGGMEPEMIIAVMQDGIGKSNPWSWIKTVLANSEKSNIKTLAQYQAKKAEKDRGKAEAKPKSDKRTFNNFKGREYDAEKLQEKLLEKSRGTYSDGDFEKLMEERKKAKLDGG